MAPSDWDFFNCSEDWEIQYVSDLYKNPDEVRDFIEINCKAGIISHWTHKKLYAYLKQNGFEKA